jgi:hypothetical protein
MLEVAGLRIFGAVELSPDKGDEKQSLFPLN